MDIVTLWFLIIGALLILMGLLGSVLQRLPLSPAMFYLAIGYALGPSGAALVALDLKQNADVLTLIAEIALLISLFSVGLRLRVELSDPLWRLPWRLGVGGMLVTIVLLSAAGMFMLHLPLGAALLLAAILAPTDPVLASDVQIRDVGDRDRIRFSLSGEGGLNDGTAYPFAMLGLFLLGVQDAATGNYAGPWALAWAVWGVASGLACGWLLGKVVVSLALYLRQHHHQALGMEEFLALGLIALSYGVSHLIHGIGFLAVFAAGVTMRGIEHKASGEEGPATVAIGAMPLGDPAAIATDPDKAPAYMAEVVLDFNQQLEHIAEFVMVLLLGIMISGSGLSLEGVLIAVLLLLVIRPLSAFAVLAGTHVTPLQRGLLAWFGIRGLGSLYYLAFALQHEWQPDLSQRFIPLVLTVLAMSIVLHGISATPLMDLYYKRRPAS
ncbi:sodium:proton antiporter [Noviherbaspirillum cavernae]|uniref:Sodium:proton antiporter n=2 Tax=Noviherbaspirillum cavernae TaxID=2320862 RepID=A0A418X6D0_9BURK|nr:sodium:proton antiporter [Noviherbaspirillum cavernae]